MRASRPNRWSPLTQFEFGTLAALWLFARAAPDAVILEVGLGGRLDAVNIVDADVAVVTTVDLDHLDYLGPTRESIGREKAGIFRPGRPAVCGDAAPPATLVEHARAIGAQLLLAGRDFGYEATGRQWRYHGPGGPRYGLPHPALRGACQLANAATVFAALGLLAERLPLPAAALRDGLLAVDLPGRFQVLPGRPAIVLDVGHNPQAARSLAAALGTMGFHPRTFAVFGMLADKDIAGVVGCARRTHRPLARRAAAGPARRGRRDAARGARRRRGRRRRDRGRRRRGGGARRGARRGRRS